MKNEEAVTFIKNLAESLDKYYGLNDDAKMAFRMAILSLKNQAEPLTDIEQRIFLAAMGREEKVCKKVDEEYLDTDCVNLVRVCHEITRKVKKVLWKN